MRRFTMTLMAMAICLTLATGCPPKPPGGNPGGDGDPQGENDDESPDGDDDGPPDDDEAPDLDGDGWSAEAGDCDDGDADVHPGAEERPCNGIDDDCDGHELEGLRVPTDHASIQDAIASAPEGGMVCVEPGVYSERISVNSRSLQVIGIGGPAVTQLDGGDSGPTVTFGGDLGPETVLAGFTVSGGFDPLVGGGIQVSMASPTLRDLVVTENRAQSCGGVALLWSNARMEDVEVSGNEAASAGGICVGLDSDVTLENVRVTDNTATAWAGGVSVEGSSASVESCWFEGNGATGDGGGLALHAADVVLSHSRFANNSSGGNGGGISVDAQSTLDASQLLLEGNSADADGGGLYAAGGSECAIEHARIVDNRAVAVGGGLRFSRATGTVSHAVIARNEAYKSGGAGFYSSPVVLEHLTVAGNGSETRAGGLEFHATDGSVLSRSLLVSNTSLEPGGGITVGDAQVSISRTAFYANWPDRIAGMADPVGTDGNVEGDPLFHFTAAVDARDWDLHLSANSPLINACGTTTLDPDGSAADPGAYGGEAAAHFDLDGDGFPLWWQPRPYAVDLAVEGFDCDDLDADVHPGDGC